MTGDERAAHVAVLQAARASMFAEGARISSSDKPAADRLDGLVDGHRISVVLTHVPPDGDSNGHTEVEIRADLPREARTPERRLVLELRTQSSYERSLVRSGRAIDIQTGDPTFDSAFIVEGAPADVIKRLLDVRVRTAVLDAETPTLRVDQGQITLTRKRDSLVTGLERGIALVALVARRSVSAWIEADDAAQGASVGAPYRQAGGHALLEAERAAEIRALAAARRSRWAYEFTWMVIIIGFFIGVPIFMCMR